MSFFNKFPKKRSALVAHICKQESRNCREGAPVIYCDDLDLLQTTSTMTKTTGVCAQGNIAIYVKDAKTANVAARIHEC